MTLDDINTLLDYHYWARDRVLAATDPLTPEQMIRNLGNSFASVHDTLAHLYGAEWVWCLRWEGTSPSGLPSPREFADLAAIRRVWLDMEQRVRGFVNRLGADRLDQPMHYRGLDGTPQAQPFPYMLQHLVNHGSYHRGQITTMLRQLGAAPPKSMDLIAFYRERAGVAT